MMSPLLFVLQVAVNAAPAPDAGAGFAFEFPFIRLASTPVRLALRGHAAQELLPDPAWDGVVTLLGAIAASGPPVSVGFLLAGWAATVAFVAFAAVLAMRGDLDHADGLVSLGLGAALWMGSGLVISTTGLLAGVFFLATAAAFVGLMLWGIARTRMALAAFENHARPAQP